MVTFKKTFLTPKIMLPIKHTAREFMYQLHLQKFYWKCYEDLPLEEPSVGVVGPLRVGFTSGLVPFIELTLKSPSFPSFTASLSVMITSCSFVGELNFSARSTVILPHLGTDIN